jgi:hypothetical protein
MENLEKENLTAIEECEKTSSRVGHWSNELLKQGLAGIVKRCRSHVAEIAKVEDVLELQRILANTPKDQATEFWCGEILKEYFYRLRTGKIDWPEK